MKFKCCISLGLWKNCDVQEQLFALEHSSPLVIANMVSVTFHQQEAPVGILNGSWGITLVLCFRSDRNFNALTFTDIFPVDIYVLMLVGSSLQKASKTTKRISKPVPGLAQSHLTFVKPLKTGRQTPGV